MIVVLGTLFVLIVDQLTKLVVRLNFLPNQSIPVIPGIFHFTYVQNPGAAFGILPYQTTFFILVTLIIMGIVIYYSYKLRHTSALMLRLGLALQLGGALGNFLDRIRFSYVVDFFDFRIFPVFNVADIGIVLGVCLFAYQLLRLEN